MGLTERNWAGNYQYTAARLHRPATLEELRHVVRQSGKLKVLGSRHSFNGLADTPGDLVSLERLDRVLALDRERGTVTVEAGVRYGNLCTYLHGEGLALHNLASLPHISVAGAVASATHGSGEGNGNLATAVTALELVTADGELLELSRERDGERFAGAVVGLGALGAVSKLTLAVEPAFAVRQDVFLDLPQASLEERLDAIIAGGYSVSLFTHWRERGVHQIWRKRRLDAGTTPTQESEWFGAVAARQQLHPIEHMPAENCTRQLGEPGPWHERLPHFRMQFTPSAGEELQSEYFVGREHAQKALAAVFAIGEQIAPLLQVSELRAVAADDLWLSPCYNRDSLAIHFTWVQDWEGVKQVLPLVEERLAPFSARPHWAKLFTLDGAAIARLYDRLPDFRALARSLDTDGKFRNDYLDRLIFAE